MSRILVVEDDLSIREGVRDNLRVEGYDVAVAGDGEHALAAAAAQPFDLVILDLMLPRISGYEVCRKLRERGDPARILMLSARGEEADRVLGLDLGADDYLAKPFGVPELLARVRALLRRAQPAALAVLEFGGCRVDFARFEATRDDARLELTRLEYGVLKYLAARDGLAVTRDELLTEVWGHEARLATRTVDNHVATLRAKIEADPAHPRHLLTIHGIGYKFVRNPGA